MYFLFFLRYHDRSYNVLHVKFLMCFYRFFAQAASINRFILSLSNQLNTSRTKVEKMHGRVNDAENADQPARHFVKVNVIIQWQDRAETVGPQKSDTLAQHKNENKRAVEVQTLAYKTISFYENCN